MSKITFRADEDLVERLEALDASKSEVMREALRNYLDSRAEPSASRTSSDSTTSDRDPPLDRLDARLDDLLDQLVADRIERQLAGERYGARDVNIRLTIEDESDVSQSRPAPASESAGRNTPTSSVSRACTRCGESVGPDHVHCPNCGEKAANRIFCECGDELRTDWSFCPGCGRRTPAADVLDPD